MVVLSSSTVFGYLSSFEFAVARCPVGTVQQGVGLPHPTLDSASYCFFDRDPTEAERDRIEACYDEFGRDPLRIRVRTAMSIWPAAFVTSGSLRTLTVSETEPSASPAFGIPVSPGGVGKATVAAATGLALADAGAETLVVSTDPAHSLGDAVSRPIDPEPVEIPEHLRGVEVDPQADKRWSDGVLTGAVSE